jgi:ribonuclease P protein component
MAKEFSFGKAEKLKSRKSIEALFAGGEAFSRFPIRVVFCLKPAGDGTEAGVKVGVSATKKHFKKAVDRNRIKRLLREAYRLQKREAVAVAKERALQVEVFFLFTGKELPAFEVIFASMQQCLKQLQKKIEAFERPV